MCIKRTALAGAKAKGEMAEWFKALVLKTSDPARDRGFESLSLRKSGIIGVGLWHLGEDEDLGVVGVGLGHGGGEREIRIE